MNCFVKQFPSTRCWSCLLWDSSHSIQKYDICLVTGSSTYLLYGKVPRAIQCCLRNADRVEWIEFKVTWCFTCTRYESLLPSLKSMTWEDSIEPHSKLCSGILSVPQTQFEQKNCHIFWSGCSPYAYLVADKLQICPVTHLNPWEMYIHYPECSINPS